MIEKKALQNMKHVNLWHDPDALRWRVILTEVREMKEKLDKLAMIVESMPMKLTCPWVKKDDRP
jgi:hypothetical protein